MEGAPRPPVECSSNPPGYAPAEIAATASALQQEQDPAHTPGLVRTLAKAIFGRRNADDDEVIDVPTDTLRDLTPSDKAVIRAYGRKNPTIRRTVRITARTQVQ